MNRIPQLRFNLTGYTTSGANAVARAAVYRPMFGSLKDFESTRKKVVGLISDWRQLVTKLQAAGWGLKRGRLDNCINCRPAGFNIQATAVFSFCQFSYLCPFCYARRVAEHYDKLHNHLHAVPKDYRSQVKVLSLVRSSVFDVDAKCAVGRLTDHIHRAKGFGYYLHRGIGSGAALASVVAAPLSLGTWKVSFRMIALTGGLAEPVRRVEGWDDRCTEIPFERLADVAKLTARTFRYPVKLLTAAPVQVLQFLKARSGQQLTSVYGDLRKYQPGRVRPVPPGREKMQPTDIPPAEETEEADETILA